MSIHKPKPMSPGPFARPEGSEATTYTVRITTVIPMVHTDPADWDFETLLEEVKDHYYAEVESLEMRPAEHPDAVAKVEKAIKTISIIANMPPVMTPILNGTKGHYTRNRESRNRVVVNADRYDQCFPELEYKYVSSEYCARAAQAAIGTEEIDPGGRTIVWLTVPELDQVTEAIAMKRDGRVNGGEE